MVAPGERFEVLVDFTGMEGKEVILRNEANCGFTDQSEGQALDMVLKFKVGTKQVSKCPSAEVLRTSDIIPPQPNQVDESLNGPSTGEQQDVALFLAGSQSVVVNNPFNSATFRPPMEEVCGVDPLPDPTDTSGETAFVQSITYLMGPPNSGGDEWTVATNNYFDLNAITTWKITNDM